MEKEHELTEKLKVLETKIHDAKIDLKGINSKLEIAYQYEDELAIRQEVAKKHTKEMRKEFFEKMGEISELYRKMKGIFDVFTGNFYRS